MLENERNSQTRSGFTVETIVDFFKNLYSFSGETTLKIFARNILFFTLATFVSLFFLAADVLHSVISLGILVAVASLFVRRLRDGGFHWAWVFVSLIPILGWVAISVLLVHKSKVPSEDAEASGSVPLWRIGIALLATFLTLAMLFTSLAAGNAARDSGQSDAVTSSEMLQSELQEQEAAAELERIAAEEAEAARIADQEKQEAEKAAAEEAARAVEEAEAAREAEQAQIDATFEQLVAGLKVEPEFIGGYDRSLFKHWIDSSGNGCDTRREVLIAESLTPVTVGVRCSISGGTWYSAFDGVTTDDASKFDIDHFVPLAEAWRSGAHSWDSSTRQRFANDLGYEMSLIAVSASSNRSKSDRDPAKWMPPNSGFKCEYVYSWVQIKLRWSLSVDQSELNAINRNWSGCSIGSLNVSPTPPKAPISTAPAPAPAPTPAPQQPSGGGTDPRFGTCKEAKAAGFGPYVRGQDTEYGWYQDRDKDGIVCE